MKKTDKQIEINEKLYEIAKSFGKANEVYSFSLKVLADEISDEISIERYFISLGKDESEDWEINFSEPISHQDLEEGLDKWLFVYKSLVSHKNYNLKKLILDYTKECEIRYLYTKPASFYDCDWVDFFIVNSSRRCLLHLGISD